MLLQQREKIIYRKIQPQELLVQKIQNSVWVERKVGQGSFGDVFLGYKKDTQQQIALKKFKNQDSVIGIPVQFIKELLIQQIISSPYLVEYAGIYYCKQDNVFPFIIATEFIDCDLYWFLKKNQKLTMDQIKKIAFGVSQGLMHLHQHGFWHLDLKPSNVLIDSQFNVKLCDFGLSQSLFTQQKIKSTPAYMAPEFILGFTQNPNISKYDSWSFGCILYELVFKHPLFFKAKGIQQLGSMIFSTFDFSQIKIPFSVTKNLIMDDLLLNQAVDQIKSNLSKIREEDTWLWSLLEQTLNINNFERLESHKIYNFFDNQDFDIESLFSVDKIKKIKKGFQQGSTFAVLPNQRENQNERKQIQSPSTLTFSEISNRVSQ